MDPQPSNSGRQAARTLWDTLPDIRFATDPAVNGNAFADKPARLKAPEEIAEFSYDENRELHLDDRSLSYYFNPSPRGVEKNTYLDKGIENFRQADDTKDDHLRGLLTAIMDYEKKNGEMLPVNFICYRGMMTNLLTLPYCERDAWVMNLTFFDGTVFIEEEKAFKLEEKKHEKENFWRRTKHHQYYGFKFERLYTIPDIWDNVSRDEIEGRDDAVVSNIAQYCSIVKTSIGETSMVIGGEIDCIWDEKLPGATSHNYVELKTTEWISPRNSQAVIDRKRFNYDMRKLKYWAQSYLIGVRKIIVGKRNLDTNQLMMPLDRFFTLEIPKEVSAWDAKVCKQTWAALLEWMYNSVKGSEGVWKLVKLRHEAFVRLVHMEPTGTGEILTEEFIAHRQSMNPSSAGVHVDGTDVETMDTAE